MINIGSRCDTGEFACDSLRQWWYSEGKQDYPHAGSILLLCDGGGSNGCNQYLFKQDLEPVYDLSVTYFPKQHLVKKIRGSPSRLSIHLLTSSFLRHFSFSGTRVSRQLFFWLVFLATLKSTAYILFSSNTRNAKTTICKLVLIKPSQFFHNQRHFSNQAKLRSTTQRLGITANVCNSLRFATSTSAFKILLTSSAKGSPV